MWNQLLDSDFLLHRRTCVLRPNVIKFQSCEMEFLITHIVLNLIYTLSALSVKYLWAIECISSYFTALTFRDILRRAVLSWKWLDYEQWTWCHNALIKLGQISTQFRRRATLGKRFVLQDVLWYFTLAEWMLMGKWDLGKRSSVALNSVERKWSIDIILWLLLWSSRHVNEVTFQIWFTRHGARYRGNVDFT